jgi:hypothetical protein
LAKIKDREFTCLDPYNPTKEEIRERMPVHAQRVRTMADEAKYFDWVESMTIEIQGYFNGDSVSKFRPGNKDFDYDLAHRKYHEHEEFMDMYAYYVFNDRAWEPAYTTQNLKAFADAECPTQYTEDYFYTASLTYKREWFEMRRYTTDECFFRECDHDPVNLENPYLPYSWMADNYRLSPYKCVLFGPVPQVGVGGLPAETQEGKPLEETKKQAAVTVKTEKSTSYKEVPKNEIGEVEIIEILDSDDENPVDGNPTHTPSPPRGLGVNKKGNRSSLRVMHLKARQEMM